MGCSSSKDKVLSINEDGTVNQAKPRLANGIAPKPQSASLETVTSTPVRATPEGIPAAVEVPSPGFVSGPQATPGFGDTLRRKADSDEALSTDAPSAISAAPSDGSSGRSGKSGAYDVHGAFDAYVLADFEAEVEGVEIRGYPTLKWYPKGNKKGVDYNDGREVENFKKFLSENSESYKAHFASAEAGKTEEL